MPLQDSDILEFRQAWQERFARQEEILNRRKQDLRQKAKTCALTLKQKYRVTKVILFGSLTGDKPLHERSDIDLAVEGLPSKDYFHALATLYEIPPTDVNIDLITLEEAPEPLYQRIIKTGDVL